MPRSGARRAKLGGFWHHYAALATFVFWRLQPWHRYAALAAAWVSYDHLDGLTSVTPEQKTQYDTTWVRWQRADGFLLWQNPPEPAREAVWADEQGRVPLFKTQSALAAFARQLGHDLNATQPMLNDLDAVANWLKSAKKRPVRECLDVWNLFDDVGAGVGEPFTGSRKTPARDRVFDLLYADSGPWQRPAKVIWPPAEQLLLRDLLIQGFELWQKHACWQA